MQLVILLIGDCQINVVIITGVIVKYSFIKLLKKGIRAHFR